MRTDVIGGGFGVAEWRPVDDDSALHNGGIEKRAKVPVKVTVIGAFPASARASYINSMGRELPPAPRHINVQDRYTQRPGLLRHIEMKSAVQGTNLATFTNRDGNVRLRQGTYLELAIALQNDATRQSGM